jgi:voltage-gated potassium channel
MRRGTVTAFVDRHTTAWEGTMAVLAAVYLAAGLLVDEGRPIPLAVLVVLTGIFLVEFFSRFLDAASRRSYIRHHWIDFVSCIPLAGGLRSLRVLRLLRLGTAVRFLVAAEHMAERRGASRQSIWFLGPLLFTVWFSAAIAYYSFEHGVNPNVNTFGDALYWAFITVTTVGYGDVTPLTAEGRIISGLLIFLGIGLIGFASGQLTARILRSSSDTAMIESKLVSLEAEIHEIKQLLLGSHGNGQRPRVVIDQGPAEHLVDARVGTD